MPRERAQIDLGGPLLREREGAILTERSLSARLCEVIERLDRVVAAAMPDLTDTEWSMVCWAGWDALTHERIVSRLRPQDVDTLAWGSIVTEAAERARDLPGLANRLRAMTGIERIAVLERIEAYGRTEAMSAPDQRG